MSIKRRRFMQALASAPAASALAQRRGGTPPAAAQPGQAGPARLANTAIDGAGETTPRFFGPEQFAALRRLGSLFMPAWKGRPGAIEAGAPEFLDFLIGVSPASHKELYLNGLDALNDRARMQFAKSFAELSDAQAGAILKPLVVKIAWVLDRPAEPLQHFIAQVHDDLRTATMNSKEMASANSGQTGGRRGPLALGTYIRPIDPVYRG